MADRLTPEEVSLIRQRLDRLETAHLPFGEGDRMDARWLATLDAARAAAPSGERPYPEPVMGHEAFDRLIAEGLAEPVPPAPDPVAGLREAAGRVLSGLGTCDQFDHHGNCQTHFIEKPCRVQTLRAALHREDGA